MSPPCVEQSVVFGMKTANLLVLFAIICGFVISGCNKQREPQGSAASVSSPKLELSTTLDAGQTEAQKHEEMLQSYARKREIVVGGCNEDCGNYKQTFHNYIKALQAKDDGQATIPFLETSEMVFNKERLGDVWVQQWQDGDMDARRNSIREFARKTTEWAKKVKDVGAFDESLANGVTFTEDDLPGNIVLFRHPAFEGDNTAAIWKFRIQARGWEWLISEIDTQYEGN